MYKRFEMLFNRLGRSGDTLASNILAEAPFCRHAGRPVQAYGP
jgi:hypothetical protein